MNLITIIFISLLLWIYRQEYFYWNSSKWNWVVDQINSDIVVYVGVYWIFLVSGAKIGTFLDLITIILFSFCYQCFSWKCFFWNSPKWDWVFDQFKSVLVAYVRLYWAFLIVRNPDYNVLKTQSHLITIILFSFCSQCVDNNVLTGTVPSEIGLLAGLSGLLLGKWECLEYFECQEMRWNVFQSHHNYVYSLFYEYCRCKCLHWNGSKCNWVIDQFRSVVVVYVGVYWVFLIVRNQDWIVFESHHNHICSLFLWILQLKMSLLEQFQVRLGCWPN